MYIDHPFSVAPDGRTASADEADHVRDLIEQVLFTAPGERVNRPTFGAGLRRLLFEPNSEALGAAVQASVQANLQQWLAERVDIADVRVEADDAVLRIVVSYRLRGDEQARVAEFREAI